MTQIGVIAIGRNEGERLRRCLKSAVGKGMAVIYVDSNSSDGSAGLARALGAEVVELDMSLPFSAARARNAGFERLMKIAPDASLVQFVDGDCEIVPGWIDRARAELDSHANAAVVCGRRRERFPAASVYNRLADLEWNTPVGEVKSCGGDSMMRVNAFNAVGGFDASVVAGEEPELCQRLREKDWKVFRIDAEMTLHDSAMLHLNQWWRRAVRSGYGAMDVAGRFGSQGLFAAQVRSARLWAIGWPLALVGAANAVGLVAGARWGVVAALVVAGVLPLQVAKLALRSRRRTGNFPDAFAYGLLTVLSKWANVVGQFQYFRDRSSGKAIRLIEYKDRSSARPSPNAKAMP